MEMRLSGGSRNRVVPRVLDIHGEDAAFLWLTRDNAVQAPHHSLKDLAKLDDRVEAHLDGLRVSGDDGWHLAQEQLKHRGPGEYFVAMMLALESDERSGLHRLSTTPVKSAGLAGPRRH
jgi:hypothetical protein